MTKSLINKMVLYTKTDCFLCRVAKDLLEGQDIEYEIKDLENAENLAEYQMLQLDFPELMGNTQMPVLWIQDNSANGMIFTGKNAIDILKENEE